ncbi:MAG: TIGR02117 family protein [Candidatus Thiodiazotropha sp.]
MYKFLPVLFLIYLSGCSLKPQAVDHSSEYSAKGNHEIYVVSHSWHTGFVIPSEEIYKSIPALEERFGDSPNIEFGWGDEGFYQAKEITTGLTIRAIIWPTESVVHAVAVPENVAGYFNNSEAAKVCLSEDELESLVQFISASFYKDKNNQVTALKKGIYGNSQFYKGAGDYFLMNTCNSWTAKGLKSVGMDISPIFKLTAGSIMSYLAEESAPTRAIEKDLPSEKPVCAE